MAIKINYDTPVANLPVYPGLIQEPVRRFIQQSDLTKDVADLVTSAILKQAEKDAQSKTVKYRAELAKTARNILSSRTINKKDIPLGVDVPEAEDPNVEEVSTLKYGPAIFEAVTNELTSRTADTIPPSMRSKFEKLAADMQHKVMGQVFTQTQKWAQEEQVADLQENLDTLLDNDLFDVADQLLSDSVDLIGPKEVQKLRRNIQVQKEIEPIKKNIIAGNVSAMKNDIKNLARADYSGLLSDDQRITLTDQLKGEIAEVEAEERKEKAVEVAKQLGNLELEVRFGDAGPADIESFWNRHAEDGFITGAKRTQLHVLYQEKIQGIQEETMKLGLVSSSIATGTKLNYHDKDHKDAVDLYLRSELEARGNEHYLDILTEVLQTGVIPEPIIGQITAMGQSDKIQDIQVIGNIMDLAKEHAPLHYSTIPLKDRAMVESINHLVEGGASPETSIAIMKKIKGYSPEQVAELNNRYAQDTSGDENVTFLEDAIDDDRDWDPIFGFAPGVSIPLLSTFNNTVKAYYMSNGDIAMSQKLAWGNLKSEWGRTEINGPAEAMHLPPNKVYGFDDAFIREKFEIDAQEFLNSQGIHDFDATELRLKSWPGTARDGSYIIEAPYIDLGDEGKGYRPMLIQDEKGQHVPATWTFDAQSERERIDAENQLEARQRKKERERIEKELFGEAAGKRPGEMFQ